MPAVFCAGPELYMHMMHDLYLALRRLQRASEIHAKRLGRHSGLTPIQLLILHSIKAMGESTLGDLAKQVSVSQATLSTIIDRLENRELLQRIRSKSDKRKVHLALSDKGAAVIQAEPALLPSAFLDRFGKLADWEQLMLLASLQRVAGLLEEGQTTPAELFESETAA
jgi:DNA-binding MarR family transcriptional regulator